MHATHWIIGCVLCIAGIGGASATSLDTDTQDLDSAPHATIDSSSPHDSNAGSGGDVTGLARDCPQNNSNASGGSSGNGGDRSGGSSSESAPSHRSHLGWQSLLPGSIQ